MIDFERHLGIIKLIADNVKIPVTADIEAGYGETADKIVDNVLRTADAGVAGINIEDSLKKEKGLRDIYQHCSLLLKIRKRWIIMGMKVFTSMPEQILIFKKKILSRKRQSGQRRMWKVVPAEYSSLD